MPEEQDDEFSLAVGGMLDNDELEIKRTMCAAHFEVAISTVHRWAKGVARPHPSLQKQVMKWIKENA